MVKNADDIKDLTKVSFSFIPSLRCNNRCSFCMYRASPGSTITLDYKATAEWMKTVEWDKVVGWGLYGGEPFIDMELYQKFYELLPKGTHCFVITNGTWSRTDEDTKTFLKWCANKFHIIVSGTQEHQRHQSVNFIRALAKEYNEALTYKEGEEEMHPMGRLAKPDWTCTKRCIWHEQPIRLGIFPTGDIILQNCDGVYPVFGTIYRHNFNEAFAWGQHIRTYGCNKGDENINDLLSQLGQ